MRKVSTTKYYRGDELRSSKCPEKDRVLRFMRGFPIVAAAAGRFRDEITHEEVSDREWLAYDSGEWDWDTRDIYHLEKYDLELDPEFIKYALSNS